MLFVHGTAGPGSWPALIRELSGFRCLVLDRPGWGLSSAVDFAGHEYQALVADMLRGGQRVLVFWDVHGDAVARHVLARIVSALVEREHLIVVHDIVDARYAPPS